MKLSALFAGGVTSVAATAALAAVLTQPPPPARPVTDTSFGAEKVTDNYRYMEKLGPETVKWMKAEGAYTRALLDSIPGRAALGKRVADFTGSFGFIQGYAVLWRPRLL